MHKRKGGARHGDRGGQRLQDCFWPAVPAEAAATRAAGWPPSSSGTAPSRRPRTRGTPTIVKKFNAIAGQGEGRRHRGPRRRVGPEDEGRAGCGQGLGRLHATPARSRTPSTPASFKRAQRYRLRRAPSSRSSRPRSRIFEIGSPSSPPTRLPRRRRRCCSGTRTCWPRRAANADEGPATSTDHLFAACAKIKPTLRWTRQYCISPAGDVVTFAWSSRSVSSTTSRATRPFNDDWTKADIDNLGLPRPDGRVQKLWDEGYMPKQPLTAYVAGDDFGKQKVAFKVSGSWMMSEIGSDYKDMLTNTGVGAFPNFARGRRPHRDHARQLQVGGRRQDQERRGGWCLPRVGDRRRPRQRRCRSSWTRSTRRSRCASPCRTRSPRRRARPMRRGSSILINDIAPTAIPEPLYPWDVSPRGVAPRWNR